MKLKAISLLIIVSVFVSGVFINAYADEQYDFTIFDGLNILQHIAGMEELTPEQNALYDFFGTGNIDIFNFVEILKYLLGMDNEVGNPPKLIPEQWEDPRTAVDPGRPTKQRDSVPFGDVITAGHLRQMGWVESALTPTLLNDLNKTLKTFNITTVNRVRHFISQCSHESGMGRWTRELASGMDYEFREDLGNILPGDGPRYKGAGYLQMTGRWNYQQFANYIGDQRVMEGVDYVAAYYPWLSAGFWWQNAKMNAFLDTNPTVEQVTRRVNGGYNGLAERQRLYDLAVLVFR
ncbi:MAG: hypothetical protein FWF94_00905 [Oscillospiraceae bacterium]|nr:hypothetical protein [Oscillospiraceae bacterium]